VRSLPRQLRAWFTLPSCSGPASITQIRVDSIRRCHAAQAAERRLSEARFAASNHVAQLLCRYFPTAPRRVSALRASARVSSSDISGKNASTTPCRPTTLGSESATP
jgi:hypothetical protein